MKYSLSTPAHGSTLETIEGMLEDCFATVKALEVFVREKMGNKAANGASSWTKNFAAVSLDLLSYLDRRSRLAELVALLEQEFPGSSAVRRAIDELLQAGTLTIVSQ